MLDELGSTVVFLVRAILDGDVLHGLWGGVIRASLNQPRCFFWGPASRGSRSGGRAGAQA